MDTDGDIALGVGEAAAAVTDGGPCTAGDAMFDGDGDMACMGAGEVAAVTPEAIWTGDEIADGDGVIAAIGADGGVGAGDKAGTEGDSACAVTGDEDSFGGGGVMARFLPPNFPVAGAGAGVTIWLLATSICRFC